ncbi:MAG: fasciclin domain-containing protein [Chitinophagaceae bacterium]
MKRIETLISIAATSLLLFISCKKQTEYFIDGSGTHNPQVNVTTYDYLKGNPLFDSTILLIDRAGLKEVINAKDATFFAPTDYSIAAWLTKLRGRILNTYGQDSARKFSLSTFTNAQLKDSLSQYIIPQRVQRENLLLTDKEFATALPGDKKIVYLREVNEYINNVTTKPRYIYLVKVFGTRDVPGTTPPAAETDIEERCQTSGILTTTGVLHVLSNLHVFGFNK